MVVSLIDIFTDISMPVLNGFESTQRIRELERKRMDVCKGYTPAYIIALTGLGSERDQMEAFEAGVDYFATKPMSLSYLRTLLEEWQATGKINRTQHEGNE